MRGSPEPGPAATGAELERGPPVAAFTPGRRRSREEEAIMMFEDRIDAGRRLAAALAHHAGEGAIVLALPRGGVPVAAEVADALGAPLDLVMVRKIGAPGHPEYGIGALVDGKDPQVVIDEAAARMAGADAAYLAETKARALAEIERRRRVYLGGRPPLAVAGRTVIVVDDGIATGSTAKAALQALRKAGAARLVLAVPVAPIETVEALRPLADEIVVLATPYPFHAVGLSYESFDQTTDEEVVAALKRGLSRPQTATAPSASAAAAPAARIRRRRPNHSGASSRQTRP